MKEFGLGETKLYHFMEYLKTGGGEGGFERLHEAPMDPPLHDTVRNKHKTQTVTTQLK